MSISSLRQAEIELEGADCAVETQYGSERAVHTGYPSSFELYNQHVVIPSGHFKPTISMLPVPGPRNVQRLAFDQTTRIIHLTLQIFGMMLIILAPQGTSCLQLLCSMPTKMSGGLLDSLTNSASAMSLTSTPINKVRIGRSAIPGAGQGVFVTGDVGANEEIYRSTPLVTKVFENQHKFCDWCQLVANDDLCLNATNQPLTDVSKPTVNACKGCYSVYYCSKVGVSFVDYHCH